VYNVEKYLKRCVDSIQRQSYKNLEIILVDDGSPDNCGQMCDELKSSDPRIKVVHRENGGLGFARNSGLEAATGEYVTFIDSDDWIDEEHIANLYAAIKENEADVALGSHKSVSVDGTEQAHPLPMAYRAYRDAEVRDMILLPVIGADVHYPQDVQISSSCCMNLYRMDIIRREKLRFESEKYAVAEDLYFNVDYLYHAKCVVATDEIGYCYFQNENSISRKYDRKRFGRTLNFYRVLSERIGRYALGDSAMRRAERSFLMKIRVAIRHIVISDMDRHQKIAEIREILNDSLVSSVLDSYPVETYIPAMRLLSVLMRAKCVRTVYLMMKFRETAKQYGALRRMIGKFGIGR